MNGAPFDYALIQQEASKLITIDQFEQAETVLRNTLASNLGPLPLWRQFVYVLRAQGKNEEAQQILEMIIRMVPGDMGARFDLAEVLLLQGDFGRGWREYRFRYRLDHTVQIGRHVQRPRWDGRPIKGKTLLIHDEQGYGDTFQFLRMVAWARERSGARIILEVNAESVSLAKRCAGFDEIIAKGTIPPAFDFHCEMMSLPMAMGLTLDDLPGTVPYLSADPVRLTKWKARLSSLPRPLIGLVWAGRPTHANDLRRSMTLYDFGALAKDGITFLGLQKGPASAQAKLSPPGMNLLSLSDEIQDFEDTAAILKVIDLLISVDSSPVHLAGALGCPAWVMLPFAPDWRWLLGRKDTPWYPSLRLFRQPQPGQWKPVLETLALELEKLTIPK